jgi:hypothetical protein
MDHTQIEVSASDTIEDVAEMLVKHAPASCVYDGVEIQSEVGISAEDIVRKYIGFRQSAEIKRRLNVFAVSNVEIIPAESPGPGMQIDPYQVIKSPVNGGLYVIFEQRMDNSIGTVAVVIAARDGALGVLSSPVVTALGSLLVEHAFREAASESRIEALELRLNQLESVGKDKKKS